MATEANGPSPKTGEGRNSMQSFVNSHVMSILEPLAEHIKEIDTNGKRSTKEIASVAERLDKSDGRLDGLDAAYRRLEEQLRPVKEDGKVEDQILALSQRLAAVEGECKIARDAHSAEAMRLDAANASILALRHHLEEGNVFLNDLAAKESKTARLAERLDNLLGELKESHAGLCERHLNLAKGQQHTLMDCENAQQILSQLTAKLQTHKVEATEGLTSASERADGMEKAIAELQTRSAVQDKAGFMTRDDVGRLSASIQEVMEQLHRLGLDRQAGQGAETADMPARLARLEDGLIRLDRKFGSELHDVQEPLRQLTERVNKSTVDAYRNSTDIQSLDATRKRHDDQLRGMELHTWELEAKGAKLRQRADVADSQLGGLTSLHKKAEAMLDFNTLEIEKTKAQQQQLVGGLDEAGRSIRGIGSELGATKSGLSGLRDRLDLAHEYIEGVGRGVQETHRHVVAGSGGMLPPKSFQARSLPDIPTPRGSSARMLS